MTSKEFNRVVGRRIQAIRSVLASKAKEYAREDRLHNFNRSADFMRKPAASVCFGFAMKHFTSIADIVDNVEQGVLPTKEMVEEKIGDAINYLVLLEAIFEETGQCR